MIMHPESHLPRLTSARKRKRSWEWTEVEAVTLAEVRQADQVAHGGGEQREKEQGHQELGIWAGVQ